MATFARRRKPPDGKPYASYRDCLRLDFSFRCAHCLIDEADYQGPDSFEVDHFQPKSRFPSLERTYANLHYCCLLCNRASDSLTRARRTGKSTWNFRRMVLFAR